MPWLYMLYTFLVLIVFNSQCTLQSRSSRTTRDGNKTDKSVLSTKAFNSACGEVFTNGQFVLQSEDYPSNYKNNFDCSYLIKGPICPTFFSFQFLDFNVESSPGCVKDRLEIQDQDAVCGFKNDTKEYYSENGALEIRFVSDGDGSGRGYKILVTRSKCKHNLDDDVDPALTEINTNGDTTVSYDTKDLVIPINPQLDGPSPGNNIQQCCSNKYNSRRLILTSPGFPETASKPYDCQYRIFKANQNICRLRIHILFFWLSPPANNQCANGFLKIDKKLICGCKSELKLVTTFDTYNNQPKILRFKNRGNIKDAYSGFVLELIQDECPTKYVPSEISELKITPVGFNFRSKISTEVGPLPNITEEASIEPVKLVNEDVDIFEDPVSDLSARVVRYFYYYALPDYDYDFTRNRREYTTYLDISSMSTVVPDLQDYGYCLDWNKKQLNELYFDNRHNLPVCRGGNAPGPYPGPQPGFEGEISSRCYELNFVKGYFHSPGYPNPYPNNLNQCYRFRKQSGFCSVKMVMQDFDLEDSPNCRKDYVLLGNRYKYCGNALHKTTSNFDLRNKEYEDVLFVTDSYDCGRGFSGVYEQIRCVDSNDPVIPPRPPSDIPNNPSGNVPCDTVIRERVFSINVYDYHFSRCRFTIKKYHPDVCKIKLYFAQFDLICATESLTIGDRMLCGRLTGQAATIQLGYGDLKVVYSKMQHPGIRGQRLKIRGTQIVDECPLPEVPPQLALGVKSSFLPAPTVTLSNSTNITSSDDALDIEYFIKIKENSTEICGIVSNTTENILPYKLCDMLKTNIAILNCTSAEKPVNFSDLPYKSKKLELMIDGLEHPEEIKFKQIDCDKLETDEQ